MSSSYLRQTPVATTRKAVSLQTTPPRDDSGYAGRSPQFEPTILPSPVQSLSSQPLLTSSPSRSQHRKSSPSCSLSLSHHEAALNLIKSTRRGHCDFQGDQSLPLGPEQYQALQQSIDKDESLKEYFLHKLRYDYETEAEKFTYRMPTALHESFISRLTARIISILQDIGNEKPNLKPVISQIKSCGSPTIKLTPEIATSLTSSSSFDSADSPHGSKVVIRSPDGTFHYTGHKLPSVILEVAHSQSSKDLEKLADSYVCDSDLSIRCVVGINLEYSPPKKDSAPPSTNKRASFSIWRPFADHETMITTCKAIVKDDEFRNDKGQARDGYLELRLSDMMTTPTFLDVVPEAERNATIKIPFTDLCNDLYTSEQRHESIGSTKGMTQPIPQGMRVVKRKRTPTEESSNERKAH